MAGALRDAHEVEVLDLCFEADPLAALEAKLQTYHPDAIGLGLRNLHSNTEAESAVLFGYYADLVHTIRRASRAPLILGGPGFSLRPSTLLDQLGADHGVVGEGERALPALLERLAAGETPARLVYGAAHSPALVRAALKLPSLDASSELDALPRPARDLVDPRYYEFDGTDNLQTKRGCAFECSYCDYPDIEGHRVRLRDPAQVAEEAVARAATANVTHLFIVDSVFNVPRSHALAVCQELSARRFALPWVCYLSPHGFDDELAEAMARAGCVGVEIGSDSGTERGLKRLRKPFSLADVERATRLCKAHGILDCHTFVLGAEDETIEEAHRTLAFVDELDPTVAVFMVFMEDREQAVVAHARHRDAILRLLREEAPRRPGWVVPELSLRFGARVTRLVQRRRLRGPSWLHLAKSRQSYQASDSRMLRLKALT
jgi:radical SAM superfamily enzyme YgiQ (UPF0313 family)